MKVTDLGAIGLVADKEAVTLPPNAWSEIKNIRFEDRSVVPFKGSASIASVTGHPETILAVKSNRGSTYLVYAVEDKIYSYLGEEAEITGKTLTKGGRWDSCVLGGIGILNNGIDEPQYWTGSGLTSDLPYDLTDVENPSCTWGSVGMLAAFFRPFRYHLFAFDILDCSGRNRRKVWWSHPAEPGQIPITWDVTKPEYDAGFIELSETPGSIVDALAMRDSLQIYKDDAVYSATYTGRQDNQIFNFRMVTDAIGLYTKGCVCDVGGRHFIVSDGDIYIYDGTNFRSIADERVKNFFFSNVNSVYYWKTYCEYYHRTGEVWLFFPSLGEINCDKALVWDVNENVWSYREVPSANCATFAIIDTTSGYTWQDCSGPTWADGPSLPNTDPWSMWVDPVLDMALQDALIVGTDSYLVRMDAGNTDVIGSGESQVSTALECYARRTHLDLGDKVDWHTVSRIMPHAEGSQFRVRVGSQDNITASVSWSEYQTFNPTTDYKLDFRITGRLHAIEFSSNADVSWKVSGYEVDFVKVGRR